MKLSWRRPRLLLSAVVAAGSLAGLTAAAAPAYAAGPYITAGPHIYRAVGPHIWASGGACVVRFNGGGWNADATIRIEALTPDLSEVLATGYVQANWLGFIDDITWLVLPSWYAGGVWVAADGAPGPTAWAYTQVSAAPCAGL